MIFNKILANIRQVDISFNVIIRVKFDNILYSTSFACLCAFRNLEHSQPVALAFLSKEEHIVMVCGDEYLFDEVLVTGVGAFGALSSPTLPAVLAKVSPLNIIKV